MNLIVIKPLPESYGLVRAVFEHDELELVIDRSSLTPIERGVVRTVASNQGVSSRYLNATVGASASGRKSSINEKLSHEDVAIFLLPSIPPKAPWCWFLVDRESLEMALKGNS